MPKINRDGVKIYYEVHGKGPIVLTHGYSATSAMWTGPDRGAVERPQADTVGHARPRPVRLSRGSRRLSARRSRLPTWPRCSTRSAPTSAVIGGLSLGGYMSLAFYRAHPRAGARAFDHRHRARLQERRRARSLEQARAETGRALRARRACRSEIRQRERAEASHRDASGLARAARGMLTQRDARVINSLPNIKVPSLIVVGADDTPFLAASDYMAAKIPGRAKGGDPGRRPRRQYRPAAGVHRCGVAVPRWPRRPDSSEKPHHEEIARSSIVDDPPMRRPLRYMRKPRRRSAAPTPRPSPRPCRTTSRWHSAWTRKMPRALSARPSIMSGAAWRRNLPRLP